jgi:hypothetical protein
MEKEAILFIVKILIIGFLYFIVFIITDTKKYKDDEISESEKLIDNIDLDEKFIFEKASTGKSAIDILRFHSVAEIITIRSLLFSCGINSLIQFANINRLYPGIAVDGYNDIRLTVFEDDLLEVEEILRNYNTEIISKDKIKLVSKIRNIIEFIFVFWYVEKACSNKKIEMIDYQIH